MHQGDTLVDVLIFKINTMILKKYEGFTFKYKQHILYKHLDDNEERIASIIAD